MNTNNFLIGTLFSAFLFLIFICVFGFGVVCGEAYTIVKLKNLGIDVELVYVEKHKKAE